MQRQGENKNELQTQLTESEGAVFDLLESLLQEVDEKTVTKVETAVETLVETKTDLQVEQQTQLQQEQKQELKTEQATELKTEQEVEIQSDNVKIFEQLPLDIQERLIAQATEELKIKNSLPEWVGHTLPCLLVEVENIELAVPLILLNGISVWDQETLTMPTQPDWHLGVIEYRGENVVIVDTARLIMPEKITQTVQERRVNHPSHFLRVGDNLALSCDEIKETISLKQEEVRWRITRTSRPWAVGTLIDRLCVLLDTEALMQEIETN
jgi:chemotaxis signal transduction protein